jgi:uncharacterized protein YhaN
MSAIEKLEQRVAELESEVAKLKANQKTNSDPVNAWVDRIFGTFANDPDYEEAMRLGRKYRESTRPKPKKRKPKGTR